MTTHSGTVAERVARIEGVLDHVATKADIERLEFQFFAAIFAATGVILAGTGAIVTIVSVLD